MSMSSLSSTFAELEQREAFIRRHIGPAPAEQTAMLHTLGLQSLDELVAKVVPPRILSKQPLELDDSHTEAEVLGMLRDLAARNQVYRSHIGMGYYNTFTPPVILRNILENPAWYTAYTPYQPEISQGRLEALINYQTMIADLTGLAIANASLLDEGTAAAEAMTFCQRVGKSKSQTFFIAQDCHPQTIAVVRTRARPLGINIVVGDPWQALDTLDAFGVLLQYPATTGAVHDYRALAQKLHAKQTLVVVATDLLALTLLTPPGEFGADVAVGSSQRFGVPFGFGGPHAAFFATKDEYKRSVPGRLVGASIDSHGDIAYRLALQTREQHIRREKATSNICTAQVLLAVIAGMYAAYHGPNGLKTIARRVHRLTATLAAGLEQLGFAVTTTAYFDTLSVTTGSQTEHILQTAYAQRINLRRIDASTVGIALDETTSRHDVGELWQIFGGTLDFAALEAATPDRLPAQLRRQSAFLTHPNFNRYHSETDMLRYLRSLSDKDLALDRAMIPLGSCTMKLNATVEMLPITWPQFAGIHPFAPLEQAEGYQALIEELEAMLCACTGYAAVSLQPNAGSQGEYAGLLAIRAYHESRGETQRDVCLIPSSAHGTNPASAHMAGLQVVVVKCDNAGNVDLNDLQAKAIQYSQRLAALMVTYPSTHGVFEETIPEICALIHDHGGQVYLDGANLNALVGLCAPGHFGADVSHLNLHKTFCIPHGGGGPGVGPIGVREHLTPFLPGKAVLDSDDHPVGPVSSAPWGSAGILPISWTYIKLMGRNGLRQATANAILNANYIAQCLRGEYKVLYTGPNGMVAHECIIDLRPFQHTDVTVEDVAKRLIDFGFHSPTMSWPVAGTLMIEPTESESKAELDRFCAAMLAIRAEIRAIEQGQMDRTDNPLKNAPHTIATLVADWAHPYSRAQAVYPAPGLHRRKYWSPVGRVDNGYGDRNLACSCPPLAAYE